MSAPVCLLFSLCLAGVWAGARISIPVELETGELHPASDIIAQSTCVALGGGGWTFAVRRKCGTTVNCQSICTEQSLRDQDSQVSATTPSCVNSLHVYQNRPVLSDVYGQDVNKLGLKTYKYDSCTSAGCGPNYCCCHFI